MVTDQQIRDLEQRLDKLEARIEDALARGEAMLAKVKTLPFFGQLAKVLEK